MPGLQRHRTFVACVAHRARPGDAAPSNRSLWERLFSCLGPPRLAARRVHVTCGLPLPASNREGFVSMSETPWRAPNDAAHLSGAITCLVHNSRYALPPAIGSSSNSGWQTGITLPVKLSYERGRQTEPSTWTHVRFWGRECLPGWPVGPLHRLGPSLTPSDHDLEAKPESLVHPVTASFGLGERFCLKLKSTMPCTPIHHCGPWSPANSR